MKPITIGSVRAHGVHQLLAAGLLQWASVKAIGPVTITASCRSRLNDSLQRPHETSQRDFPHRVEMIVPKGGFGRKWTKCASGTMRGLSRRCAVAAARRKRLVRDVVLCRSRDCKAVCGQVRWTNFLDIVAGWMMPSGH